MSWSVPKRDRARLAFVLRNVNPTLYAEVAQICELAGQALISCSIDYYPQILAAVGHAIVRIPDGYVRDALIDARARLKRDWGGRSGGQMQCVMETSRSSRAAGCKVIDVLPGSFQVGDLVEIQYGDRTDGLGPANLTHYQVTDVGRGYPVHSGWMRLALNPLAAPLITLPSRSSAPATVGIGSGSRIGAVRPKQQRDRSHSLKLAAQLTSQIALQPASHNKLLSRSALALQAGSFGDRGLQISLKLATVHCADEALVALFADAYAQFKPDRRIDLSASLRPSYQRLTPIPSTNGVERAYVDVAADHARPGDILAAREPVATWQIPLIAYYEVEEMITDGTFQGRGLLVLRRLEVDFPFPREVDVRLERLFVDKPATARLEFGRSVVRIELPSSYSIASKLLSWPDSKGRPAYVEKLASFLCGDSEDTAEGYDLLLQVNSSLPKIRSAERRALAHAAIYRGWSVLCRLGSPRLPHQFEAAVDGPRLNDLKKRTTATAVVSEREAPPAGSIIHFYGSGSDLRLTTLDRTSFRVKTSLPQPSPGLVTLILYSEINDAPNLLQPGWRDESWRAGHVAGHRQHSGIGSDIPVGNDGLERSSGGWATSDAVLRMLSDLNYDPVTDEAGLPLATLRHSEAVQGMQADIDREFNASTITIDRVAPEGVGHDEAYISEFLDSLIDPEAPAPIAATPGKPARRKARVKPVAPDPVVSEVAPAAPKRRRRYGRRRRAV